MELKERYPKIFSKLDQDYDETRYLVVVDENYDDIDSDEFDIFNPEDYNYLVYIQERIQEILGHEGMSKLIAAIESIDGVDDFIEGEIDNYGIKSALSEEALTYKILDTIESMVVV